MPDSFAYHYTCFPSSGISHIMPMPLILSLIIIHFASYAYAFHLYYAIITDMALQEIFTLPFSCLPFSFS